MYRGLLYPDIIVRFLYQNVTIVLKDLVGISVVKKNCILHLDGFYIYVCGLLWFKSTKMISSWMILLN